MIDKETHRLAVINMGWDHIKAVDLYMVMIFCFPKVMVKIVMMTTTTDSSEAENNKLRTYDLNRLSLFLTVWNLNILPMMLLQSRVKLTWDDDEPECKKVLRRKFNDDQMILICI